MKGTIWLALGLLFGFAAVVVLAIGIYAISHTQKNVRIHEEMVEREARELEKLKPGLHLPENRAKANECRQIIEFGQGEVHEYKFHRNIAFVITASSIVPGGIALLCMFIFLLRRLK